VELLVRGGIFMLPILLCSVISLWVLLERAWMLRRENVLPRKFLAEVEYLFKKRKLADVQSACQGNDSPVARIILTGLQYLGKGREFIKEGMEDAGISEGGELRRYLGLLSMIATISPLLGLLGTVSGMIKVFKAISVQGAGNPGALAAGISEALITTAAGLSVAIPTIVIHRYLSSRVERLIRILEEYATYIMSLITEEETG
jgi:biopolymer transport protein ExbB